MCHGRYFWASRQQKIDLKFVYFYDYMSKHDVQYNLWSFTGASGFDIANFSFSFSYTRFQYARTLIGEILIFLA